MTEESRKEIVKLQFEKAYKFLKQADRMLEESDFDMAANRYYYACYHAIQGVFINDGLSCHTHRGLHQMLGLNYVISGKFDSALAGIFRTMEQLREKADYNCAYNITEAEAREMQNPSHQIIELAKELTK